jgi:hypothetical protein
MKWMIGSCQEWWIVKYAQSKFCSHKKFHPCVSYINLYSFLWVNLLVHPSSAKLTMPFQVCMRDRDKLQISGQALFSSRLLHHVPKISWFTKRILWLLKARFVQTFYCSATLVAKRRTRQICIFFKTFPCAEQQVMKNRLSSSRPPTGSVLTQETDSTWIMRSCLWTPQREQCHHKLGWVFA